MDFTSYTAMTSDEYSQKGQYFSQIETREFGLVYMWTTLTVYDGPVAADGTYFFNYFQIEQSDAPGTYESFSCWAPYEATRESVPPEDVRVVNYYGDLTFFQG